MRRASKLPGQLIGALVGALLLAPEAAADTGDPQVIRFHDGGYDQASAIAVDADDNIYLAGSIGDGPGLGFAVAKLSPAGATQWTGHHSGLPDGVGRASAVAVYAAGFVAEGGTFNLNYDYLVVKFGPDGAQRWAQRFDGPAQGDDRANRVAADSAGNVYVTGFSYGENYYDWSTHKYGPDGTRLWERRHSGSGAADDRPGDMMLAPDGNVVVTGFTKNAGDGQTNDIDTVTYDPAGAVVWQARWTDTATSHEEPADLDIDAAGRIAVSGSTAAAPGPYADPFPITLRYDSGGALMQTIRTDGGKVDVGDAGDFVIAGFSKVSRYDAAGTPTWSTPLITGSRDVFGIVSVATDSTGHVTVAGTITDIFNHNQDYLTVRYDPDGRELWRYRFDGPVDGVKNGDTAAGLAIDSTDAALVTGTSWNDYLSNRGGTADDIVTLRFAAGDAPALHAPSDLTATGISRSQIRLSWSDNSGTEDGFGIERCAGTGCTDFAEITTVGHDTTSYTDGGLSRNARYTYRIRAFNSDDTSPYSNIATGKTRNR